VNKLILKNLYQKVKGRKITGIKALVYVSLDNVYDFENPYDISFIFDNDECLNFSCGCDFVSLDVKNKRIQGFDMQDSGRAEVVDFSTHHPFSQVLNNSLVEVFILHSGVDDKNIGCSLSFGDIDISILNLGDEIFYFSPLSNELILGEKITSHKL